MISKEQFQKELELIIANSIREDVGDGDHSSLACIPADAKGKTIFANSTPAITPVSLTNNLAFPLASAGIQANEL